MEGNVFYFDWEPALIEWIQARLGQVGEFIALLFTTLGQELVLVAIVAVLYLGWDKAWGKRVGRTMLLCCTVFPMIKNIFDRRRPYFDCPGVRCLRPVNDGDIYDLAVQGYSFPSGHSANAVACYVSCAWYVRKKWLIAIACVLALFIGVSRFALGVHYPTDVLAGWALGALLTAAVVWLEKHITKEWLRGVICVAVGLPGLFYCRSEDFFTSYGMLIGFSAAAWFEERYVRFENTRDPLRIILRAAVGVGLFLGLNELLKLPFPPAFLDGGTRGAMLVRLVRYALDIFAAMGLYPMLFRFTGRLWRRPAGETVGN